MKVNIEIRLKENECSEDLVKEIYNNLRVHSNLFKATDAGSEIVLSFKSEWSTESATDLLKFLIQTEREEVAGLVLREGV